MNLEIVTPDKKVYTGTVKLVQVPGADGSFEVLTNHAAIISTLVEGKVRIVEENDAELNYNIQSGVIEVNNNKIILLAEMA